MAPTDIATACQGLCRHQGGVKPRAAVGTIAAPLLEATAGNACLLWVDLSTWLATMLREEVRQGEEFRQSAPRQAVLPEATTAERMSRLWLMEQLQWQRLTAGPQFASRLLDLVFADILTNSAPVVAKLARHYRIDVPLNMMGIDDSQILTHYAKGNRRAFDSNIRHRELAAA